MPDAEDIVFVSVADAVRDSLMTFPEVVEARVSVGRNVNVTVVVADNARCVVRNDYKMAIINVLPIELTYRLKIVWEGEE